MDSAMYRFLNHIDAPKRYMTLTIEEMVIAGTCLMLLIVAENKLVVLAAGLILVALLRRLKKGNGPRYLIVLVYWYFGFGFQ